MTTSGWTAVTGGAVGLILAIFGVRVLITGRAPTLTARAFRNVKDAGCYHLLFGVALILVVVGASMPGGAMALGTTVLAVVLVGIAMIRFRPRGRRSADQK